MSDWKLSQYAPTFALFIVAAAGAVVGMAFALLVAQAMNFAHAYFEKDECAGAPKVVEFRQGMTLCPGQSAILHFPITLEEGRSR